MKNFLTLIRFVAVLAVAMLPAMASAQAYPNRSIRLLVPYAAGGQPDIVARVVAKQMSTFLAQAVVVENVAGGSGITAINQLLAQKPDGYTLIALDAGHWAVAPAGRAGGVPYDPVKSFSPVGLVTTSSLFVAVHEAVPAKTMTELIALAKQKPGTLNYGSSGVGSVHHLTIEALKQAHGLDIVHVPYRGTSQSVPALVAGQVQIVVASLSGLAQFEKAGKVRILAANTAQRSALAPDTPAISEVAPGLDFPGQVGFLTPAGLPKEVGDRLQASIEDAMKSPEVLASLKAAGVEPAPNRTPDALAQRIQDDRVRYGALIKAAGIKLE